MRGLTRATRAPTSPRRCTAGRCAGTCRCARASDLLPPGAPMIQKEAWAPRISPAGSTGDNHDNHTYHNGMIRRSNSGVKKLQVAGPSRGHKVRAAVPGGMPSANALAAFRARYEGLSAAAAVQRFLPEVVGSGNTSRTHIGRIRKQLVELACVRRRQDLADLFARPPGHNGPTGAEVAQAIEELRHSPPVRPSAHDVVDMWLSAPHARALRNAGIHTLADVAVRASARRRWWSQVPRIGPVAAGKIQNLLANEAQLLHRAQELAQQLHGEVMPWEAIVLPQTLNGSSGRFRAPRAHCAIRADNDYEAIQSWLSLHESAATTRAYRKEAERLLLWALLECRCPLSSLTAEDAVSYRTFLRNPRPAVRWIGPPAPRGSAAWRPFKAALSPRSVAYALSVLTAMFRWLVEQDYLVNNPFSGLKVRGGAKSRTVDASRALTQGEWEFARAVAQTLEHSAGWSDAAAQRLRFILDFTRITGLRASELCEITLGMIAPGPDGRLWLKLSGKGAKLGKVAIPPSALAVLELYLSQRSLPTVRAQWDQSTPVVARLQGDGNLTPSRLWAVVKRFFNHAAKVARTTFPATADRLQTVSPHWLRHTHASHALAAGVDLASVRDNLRHASIATTSGYLHTEDSRRADQIASAFKT